MFACTVAMYIRIHIRVDVPAPLAALAATGGAWILRLASVRALLREVSSEEACLRIRTLIARPASIAVGCFLEVSASAWVRHLPCHVSTRATSVCVVECASSECVRVLSPRLGIGARAGRKGGLAT